VPFGRSARGAQTGKPIERWPRPAIWAASLVALGVVTLLMLVFRGALDKAHVALGYLLMVLAGSAAGGRVLGFTLAGLAFLAFDVLFLPPYGTLVIANPLDWLVLIAFLITSVIAAQLLTRAQDRAEDARVRTAEVERLSVLGSETLNVVRAEDALGAIAEVIQSTLGVDQCDMYIRTALDREPRRVAHVGEEITRPASDLSVSSPASGQEGQRAGESLLAWVSSNGVAAAEQMDGTLHIPVGVMRETSQDGRDAESQTVPWGDFAGVRVLTVPLRVRTRTVGVLCIANQSGITLVPQQQLFLDALTYYAALGVERVRLAAEAEYVETMREADRVKNALLAAVSHDLRTPLTTIKALAHAVVEGGASAGDPRVRSIEEEADHLTAFVIDLLDLSRLQGGALQLHPAINTAEDLVGAALQRVVGVQGDHVIRIRQDRTAPMLLGHFDFVHALRALVNLLDNAVKYSGADHEIELSIGRDAEMLVFTVADRGPGVPDAERERIFEPFYRPPNVPPDVRGAGLGLAIARGLATAQGGTIRYEPRAEGGSLFHLMLPAADDMSPIR
jgi:two-component system, OmpR family, sensor histidine kinase KdpD